MLLIFLIHNVNAQQRSAGRKSGQLIGSCIPVVVYCNATLSLPISLCKCPSFHADKTILPVPCTMHFGGPVVPLLYTIKNPSWNPTLSNFISPRSPFSRNASSDLTPLTPSTFLGWSKNRGTLTTPSNSAIPFIPSTISPIFVLRSVVFPLYNAASSTNSHFGLICFSRSSIPAVPMSQLLLLNNPPRLVTPRKTQSVSRLFPATTATLSPFFTPCLLSAEAKTDVLVRSWPHLISRIEERPSRTSTTATRESSL